MELEPVFRWIVVGLFSLLAGLRLLFKWRSGTLVDPPRVRAEGLAVVLLRTGLSVPLLALVLAYAFGRPEADALALDLPAWLRFLGLPLGLAALALLRSAHAALDGWFSPTLRLREGHRLVEHGPYAWVQHPIYSAYLAFFVAVFLLSANPGIGGLGLAVILSLVTLRLPREEALLRDRFGAAWERWAGSTGRFLPRLSRLRSPRTRPAPGPD